jgi:hypothetical protein
MWTVKTVFSTNQCKYPPPTEKSMLTNQRILQDGFAINQKINSVLGKYGERDRNDASSLKAGSQAPDNIISSWLNFLVFTLFWQIFGLRRRIIIWKASPVTSL